MENNKHRFVVVSYKLYCNVNGEEKLFEETDDMKPMELYTGCDLSLPAFEQEIVKFEEDADFEFTLTKAEAYGEHDASSVIDFDKGTFSPNGVFDAENIYKGAVVPLQNEEGQRFLGTVLEIDDDKVTIDLNHPLAGKDLIFRGHVYENREASEEEVKDFFEKLKQHHCGGGCGGGCGSDCGSGGGCGGHEESEEGCCGCH